MPYVFRYDNGRSGARRRQWYCHLAKRRCEALTRRRERCRMEAHLTLPFCWMHLRAEARLNVADSRVHGKGLFAHDPAAARRGEPVFRDGDAIIAYEGFRLTPQQEDVLYDRQDTIPYGAGDRDDAACVRGAAAAANTIFFTKSEARRLRRKQIRGVRVIVDGVKRHGRSERINAIIVQAPEHDVPYLEAIRDIGHGEEILAWYGTRYNVRGEYGTTYARKGRQMRPNDAGFHFRPG